MNVIVLGNGQLGREISRQSGWPIVSRTENGLDAANRPDLSEYIPEGTQVVINCIAHTATYSSEKNTHWSVNYEFVHNLIQHCEGRGIKLVQISTDYVYAGCSVHPSEESGVPVHAENWYSYTKLLGDSLVELLMSNYLICRCIHKGRDVNFEIAYVDRVSNFLYTDEAAAQVIELVNGGAQGIYNLGHEPLSAFDWLRHSIAGLIPGNTPQGLPRDTSMNTDKLKKFQSMKEAYTLIESCPITGNPDHFTYFDLGNFPLVNNLNSTHEESLNCERYPLRINYFRESGLSALSHAVDGEILFKNYLYKSEVNIPYIKHGRGMFKTIQETVELQDGDLIIDIGGNDGSLLAAFNEDAKGQYRYLNIDPSENLASLSIGKGVPVLTEFFSADTVSRVDGKAKVITSTNVFQHLKDTNSFAEGVSKLLTNDSIWVLEFPYWIHDMETLQFDQTYHEHVYYYTVSALKLMMEKHGMKIISATEHEIHGGSMRLIMALQTSALPTSANVAKVLKREKPFDENYYRQWGAKVSSHLREARETIQRLKSEGYKVAGFGAAAKGCIFLNAAGITYKDLEYIVDDTDLKQGKYVPGTGIGIVGREALQASPVDYIVILAHNFAQHIMESLKDEYTGKFLVLLPEIKEYTLEKADA